MPHITWSSTARRATGTEPEPRVPLDLAALLAQWRAAPNKADFMCRLPLDQAAALVSLAREHMAPEPLLVDTPPPAMAQKVVPKKRRAPEKT